MTTSRTNRSRGRAQDTEATGATHVDNITCVVCARKLPDLFVRILTGVCTLCEPVSGRGGGQ